MSLYLSGIEAQAMSQLQAVDGIVDSETVANDIITSIADAMQTDVLDLPPLYETIDTEAVAELVQGDGVSEIAFSYHGRAVAIDGDGRVRVSEDEA